jgi:hypothetical protein
MHADHRRVVIAAELLASVGKGPFRVSLRDGQLDQPLSADGEDEQ